MILGGTCHHWVAEPVRFSPIAPPVKPALGEPASSCTQNVTVPRSTGVPVAGHGNHSEVTLVHVKKSWWKRSPRLHTGPTKSPAEFYRSVFVVIWYVLRSYEYLWMHRAPTPLGWNPSPWGIPDLFRLLENQVTWPSASRDWYRGAGKTHGKMLGKWL